MLHKAPSPIVLILSIAAMSAAQATTFTHEWSQRFGDEDVQVSWGVATDPAGNVLLTGSYRGSVNFGGGELPSAGDVDVDVWIAALDPSGNHLWSRRFGDAEWQGAGTVTTDVFGNVILIGSFKSTIDLGGGLLTSGGSADVFLAKFDAAGHHLWSRSFGLEGDQFGIGAACDQAGNVYITGYYFGSVDFGGGVLPSASQAYDVYLVKLDPFGNHLWSRRFGDELHQLGLSIAAHPAGGLACAGWFEGNIDFGGGVFASAGGRDGWVARFDDAGNHLWSRRFGDAQHQATERVALDASGNVILAGDLEGTVDFGGGVLVSAGDRDIVLAKFDAAGHHLWSRSFGDANHNTARGLAIDPWGNVILSGYYQGTLDFGGGPLTSAGDWDIFVASFDPDGHSIASARYGDAGYQINAGIASSLRGETYLLGSFQSPVDFGGGPLTHVGSHDVYLVKFRRDPSVGLAFENVRASWQGDHVEVRWSLVEGTEATRFDVFREDVGRSSPAPLSSPGIVADGREYTLTDSSVLPGSVYRYRVVAAFPGRSADLSSVEVTVAVPSLALALEPSQPNPFRTRTMVPFVLGAAGEVSLSIFSPSGRLVRTLSLGILQGGRHSAEWDGRNGAGALVASGTYFYRLTVQGKTLTQRTVLVK